MKNISLISDIISIANELDTKKLYAESDVLTKIAAKLSNIKLAARGAWRWNDETDQSIDEAEAARREPLIKLIVRKINEINNKREQKRWQQEDNSDKGLDYEFENDADMHSYQQQQELEQRLDEQNLQALYRELEKLGARMERNYEHWNENEHYMQMMEGE